MNYARSSPDPTVELAARILARKHLLDFTTYTNPQYIPEPAHHLIAGYLEGVLQGEIDRLMIFAPPQHGKSELVSVRMTAFHLACHPSSPIILTSYAASLAYAKSREARAVVESPAFRVLFPSVRTDRSSRAVNYWRIQTHSPSGWHTRGGVLASGVGGPITGHGAALGIIDDPFENWEQASSPTIRDKVWNWYRTTFRTRIWEKGAIILVMTRWHEDDLAGRLLQQQPGRWTVLRLPALAETQTERNENDARLGLPVGNSDPLGREPGEPLCPQRFSRATLEELRNDIGSLAWYAEYQGVPRQPEGGMFKRHWFTIVEASPAAAQRLRYWDKAATEGAGNYTVGVRMAVADGIYYVEDVVRGRWSTGQREAIIRQTSELDGLTVSIWVEQEAGSGGKDSTAATIRSLAGFTVRPDRVTGDKVVRAGPFAAQCEAGNVRLVRGEWNGAFIEELTAFPQGTHDDQVDAASGAFNKLARGPRYSFGIGE